MANNQFEIGLVSVLEVICCAMINAMIPLT
jgi:hypothetical protein